MQTWAEWVHPPTADRILSVDPKPPVLVGIERHRLAVTLQIRRCRCKIIEGTFALDKLQMHQAAGGVVDEDEQGALWPPSLEPPVFRTVDLDQFAQAIAAIPRLMNSLQPGPAILP